MKKDRQESSLCKMTISSNENSMFGPSKEYFFHLSSHFFCFFFSRFHSCFVSPFVLFSFRLQSTFTFSLHLSLHLLFSFFLFLLSLHSLFFFERGRGMVGSGRVHKLSV